MRWPLSWSRERRRVADREDEGATRVDRWALGYLALPNALFVAGWIFPPLGPLAGLVLALGVVALARRRIAAIDPPLGPVTLLIVAIAALWCVLAGLGHFVYANSDWVVRDAVLLDLVRRPWPVTYSLDGVATVLRAPIGYFLPAALVGKLWGVRAAELALLAWTVVGVSLTFALMLRDRPPLRAALVRIGVFVAFSGMDVLGMYTHYNPFQPGDHLEWWAFVFQYSSQTTQLFWVPNHALPGWIAIAWLLGQDPRRLPLAPAILFVVFVPLWSPLTAIGVAPLFGVAIVRRLLADRFRGALATIADWRLLLPLAACVVLVLPYLVAGSDAVASGSNADLRWVGEDIVPRVIEFALFEFAGFALLLLKRDRLDPLLWTAIVVLLALPFYRFGPYNDLVMRGSIPSLSLLAIGIGRWLSQPVARTRGPAARWAAVALLAVGAVTPAMELARIFIEPRWDLDDRASVVDVTRGSHYLTPAGQPWMEGFLRRPDR